MTQAKMKDTLRSMVREYGFDRVNQTLIEIGAHKHEGECSMQDTRPNNGTGSVRSRLSHCAAVRCEDGTATGDRTFGGRTCQQVSG